MKPSYEELEKTVEKLQRTLDDRQAEVSRLKSSFLSMISHEVRTPMHAIMGFSQLLAGDNITREEQAEYLELIMHCGNNLLGLVDNMIDAALIESGDLKLNPGACHIGHLLDKLYHSYGLEKHRLEKYSIALLKSNNLPFDDFVVITDPFRLNQILSHLLDNALKFTERGVIEFGCFLPGGKKVQFFVRDSGSGHLSHHINEIFDTFNTSAKNESINRGAGLGLAIVKGLVNLMGGKIWVEENAFEGSTFYFDIPLVMSDEGSDQPVKYQLDYAKRHIA